MITLEAAIDDYLHTIVRSRPWAKKREEELLTPFSEWLAEQEGARTTLDAITPRSVDQYVAATRLTADDHEALLMALHNLYTWEIYDQKVESNPFENAITVS